jgi:tetratricopeptide (TPR) repeat protein
MSWEWLPAAVSGLLATLQLAAATGSPVHAWQDSLTLPTYGLGEPSPTPQFAILNAGDAANYPYPVLDSFTKDKRDRVWRTLNLENEYLFCRVLPDLGGHLYSCRDKRNGREMFYANPVIKPADVGLRGAGVSLGIESNFPVGHTRSSISPIDFAVDNQPDGSGRAIVEDIDRLTGMKWRVEYVLHPASTVLEQRVTLSNDSPVRWPYYWWANAATAFDDPGMRVILPAYVASTHTTPAEIVPWPVTPDGAGRDGTLVANYETGGGWFAYGSREPFFAVFKPAFRSGLVHYADPSILPGKKIWIWGAKQDEWVKRELTDGFSSYVEMQSGRFQNQNMFQFLAPGHSVRFSEFWIPVFDMDGVTRATRDVILNLQRRPDMSVQVELSPTHAIRHASLQIVCGGKKLLDTLIDLDPSATIARNLEKTGDSRCTVQLVDPLGRILLRHTEGVWDADTPDRVRLGTVPPPYPDSPETAALSGRGEFHELERQWASAWADYAAGRKAFPANRAFSKDGGIVALNLDRFAEAVSLLSPAVAADASDAAAVYGLGLAQATLGEDAVARQTLARVLPDNMYGAAAIMQLAFLAARAKDDKGALALLKPLLDRPLGASEAGAFSVALLRRSGHAREAGQLLDRLHAADPADSILRFERVLAGNQDEDLWKHLAADGERVLNLVDRYLAVGSDEDALRLLGHAWPAISPAELEPGAVPAATDPLIAYYRAFVRTRLGLDAAEDLRTASAGPTQYVFPSRWSSVAVLNSALKANPSDAHAHLLLGRFLLYQMKVDEAIAQWQEARKLDPALPGLDRDLQQVLAAQKKSGGKLDPARAPPPELAHARANPAPIQESSLPTRPSSSPADIATAAMLKAAAGRADEAAGMFDPRVFSAEKQPDPIRQAWIEVQLQRLLSMARRRQCRAAMDGLFHLGDQDTSLGFTLYGFGRFMKLAHFAYYTATLEAACDEGKQARKDWTRVSRMREALPSPEFVFPVLATMKLAPGADHSAIGPALASVRAALANADPAARAPLIFAEAMLLKASGENREAASRFEEVLKSGDTMVRYLALTEMTLASLE